MPGWFASATTRFLNVSLQRRREVLGRDVMTFLPAQIQADSVGMFGRDCKAVSGGRLRFIGLWLDRSTVHRYPNEAY